MGTLSYHYGKPYGYRGEPGTCAWCGDELRPEETGGAGGYRDNGIFDTMRCGYQWAVTRCGARGRITEMETAVLDVKASARRPSYPARLLASTLLRRTRQ